jgi:uncharacterized protein DUF4331
MSHHLDSPLARKDPRLDISDVYLFKGNSGTVFVMNVNPQSGANGFHHEAMYEFKIDTSGDVVEDITYRATFSEKQTGEQTVTVRKLTGLEASDRMAEGTIIAEGVTNETIQGTDGVQVFAGQSGEPFYIDGTVVTAVKKAVAEGSALDLASFDITAAANIFGKTNVSTIVIEVPNDQLGDSIHFWGTVALATDAGGWGQVQRAATPLMNTLYDFSEIHLDDNTHADYNATHPTDDMKIYGAFVTAKTTAVIAAMDTAPDPAAYAKELTAQLFPDVLHYTVGSPASFTANERNGRDLTVNTPEVMFSLVLHKEVPMGLDATAACGGLRQEFPYVSLPA